MVELHVIGPCTLGTNQPAQDDAHLPNKGHQREKLTLTHSSCFTYGAQEVTLL